VSNSGFMRNYAGTSRMALARWPTRHKEVTFPLIRAGYDGPASNQQSKKLCCRSLKVMGFASGPVKVAPIGVDEAKVLPVNPSPPSHGAPLSPVTRNLVHLDGPAFGQEACQMRIGNRPWGFVVSM
jgi:hypothetical protein